MSAENDWFEQHLTTKGWIVGSKTVGHFGKVEEVPYPEGRVLTLRFRTHQSSSFSKTRYWYEEEWKSEDGNSVSSLTQQFGDLPESFKHWTKEGFSQ